MRDTRTPGDDGTRTRVLTVFAACALGSASAHAADWQFAPRVEFGATYDDNYTLDEDRNQKTEVEGSLIDATFGIESRTPTTEFFFRPRVESTYYPDESDQDATNGYADLDFRRRGLKNAFRIQAGYSHVSVVDSDLPNTQFDPDLGQIDDAESGRFFQRNRRDQADFRPSASFKLTERTALDLSARYRDVSYDKVIPGDQEGYQDTSAAVGLAYEVTPVSSLSLIGTVAKFEPDSSTGRDSDSYTGELRYEKRYSETRSFYVSGGSTHTEFDAAGISPARSANTFVAGTGTRWTFRVTDLFLDLAHRVAPSSTGAVQELDEARIRVVRRLTPTLSGVALGRYAMFDRGNTPGAATSSNDRKNAAAQLGMEWRFRRSWSLSGTYEFRWRKDDADPTDAKSNGIFFGAIYEPRRRD